MKLTFSIVLGLALCVLVISCSNPGQTDDTSTEVGKPNILIFFSDELAPEYLSCYGGEIPTPHLDQLASQGIRFDRAYTAASMCTPSRFSLMTGQYPGRCQHPQFMLDYPKDQPYSIAWNVHLTNGSVTIAKLLAEQGYHTGMAGKWHIGTFEQAGIRPAFTENESLEDPATQQKLKDYQKAVKQKISQEGGFQVVNSALWGNFDAFPHPDLKFHNFPWITKGAIDFLEQQKNAQDPFFLYVATTAVHGPSHHDALDKDVTQTPEGKINEAAQYQPNIDSLKAEIQNIPGPDKHKYAGMAYLDHHVGTVLKKLAEIGKSDNTIILFMADHNVEPGKATTYEKGIHIPMIVSWPGVTSGAQSSSFIQTIDVLPTLAALAGAELPQDHQIDGMNMVELFEAPSRLIRQHVYTEAGYTRAINDGKYKYVAFKYPQFMIEQMQAGEIDYAPNQLGMYKQAHSSIAIEAYPAYFAPDQLYDLENDPYEQNNLVQNPEYQAELERMQEALDAQLKAFDHPYDMNTDPFRQTSKYQQLVEKTKALGTDYIPWLRSHHGGIVWPPNDRSM